MSILNYFKPLSPSLLHPQRMFQRPHQIAHSDIGELPSDDQNIPLTKAPSKYTVYSTTLIIQINSLLTWLLR